MRRTFSAAWPATAAAWGRFQPRTHPALLVVSPRAAAHGDGRPERCRMALLPGDTTLPGWDLQAASAVSYGSGPKKHPHSVQPGGAEAVAGPPAGAGHHPGPGGGPAGVPLDVGPRRLPPVRPGGGGSPPPAGRPAGPALRPPLPGIAGNCIRLLTNLVSWYTIMVPPL